MNPFFFGRSARQLYGAYDPPGDASRDLGIVLCPPLGDEQVFAHPTYRLLARQLAAAGCHVLRFDYYGSGDSAGDFEDTNQADWRRDVDTAITELMDVGQVSRVALIGLRFGGTLAAEVAATRDDVDRLVLWDVICDGREYLAEIHATPARPDEIVDACGLGITPRARTDIEAVTLESFGPPLPKTLIVTTAASATKHEMLRDRLISAAVDCTLQHTPDTMAWKERPVGTAAMPVNTLKRIVAWLS
ncbi:MAG TPA: alpha/beta fold hydrolase [Gemmatimonadaceae bacterium]|nr:alpha/beta fold hydrolase [Gemmatimonadaceae bacterium]